MSLNLSIAPSRRRDGWCEFLDRLLSRPPAASRATRALHSTSNFPEILSAITNKTLRQAYEAYPRIFMLFCRQVLATDFKAMHRVQLGEAPQLLEVGESGEFKRGTLGDRAAMMYTLIVTAKMSDVDPQAWRADVLARIAGLPQARLSDLLPWN